MKISKRMIPIFILIISVSMSAALFVYEMTSRQDRSAQIQYSVISSSVYEAISNEITKPIYTSLTIANDILLKDLLQKEEFYSETEAVNIISKYLESVKKSIGADTAF